jgi:hypothetical protein
MDTQVHSDSHWRDAFLTGAAKAFFCMAYANHVEDEDREDDGFDYAHAGCGGDWMDVLPPLPPNAYALAGELWEGLDRDNPEFHCSVYGISNAARDADGAEPDPEEFGHYMAMEAMGSGVSWFDSHEQFPLCVPTIECSSCTFDPLAYQAG